MESHPSKGKNLAKVQCRVQHLVWLWWAPKFPSPEENCYPDWPLGECEEFRNATDLPILSQSDRKKNRGGTVHWFATSHLNYQTGYLNSESFLGAHAESPSVHETKATGVSYVFWTIAYSCCYCKTTRAGRSQWRLAISHQLGGEHLSYYSAVFLTWLLYMIKLLINCIVNVMGRLFC